MTKRHRAFQEMSLDSDETLVASLKFLAIIAIIGVAIDIPIASLAGLKYESNSYIISRLFVLFVLWFCYATLLHVCMKVFGGRATYRETIALFCFLTAFFPPIMLLQMPFARYFAPTIKDSPSVGAIFSIWSRVNDNDMYLVVISSILSLVFSVWFVIVLFRSSNSVHGVSGLRALSANILFLISLWIFIIVIAYPFQNFVLRAFA